MTTLNIIHRKSAVPRSQSVEGAAGADRAFRFCLGRAVHDSLHVQLEIEKLTVGRLTAAELVEISPDFALIAVLDGPAHAAGAMVLSHSLVSGFIEVQTIGRVRGQDVKPRKPTRTDGAMVAGVIDSALTFLDQALVDESLGGCARGFQCCGFLEDSRPLPVILEDASLIVFAADVALAGGVRKGQIFLALPAPGQSVLPVSQDEAYESAQSVAFGAALKDCVDECGVQLQFALARVSLPMSDVLNMAAGMIVPLRGASLGAVSVEGMDGRCLAIGKLGQNRGLRAVRLVEVQLQHTRMPVRPARVFMGSAETHSSNRANTELKLYGSARLEDDLGHSPNRPPDALMTLQQKAESLSQAAGNPFQVDQDLRPTGTG